MSETSLSALAAQLKAKQISSRELAQQYLDRIAALNPAINAFITLDADKTLAEAAAADALIAAGQAGPLTGVPIAHKDIFCTDGWLTTCGSKMLHNFIAPYDAHVIQQFKAAGMPSLGKTNMDEFAMGSSQRNLLFRRGEKPLESRLRARRFVRRRGRLRRRAHGARRHRHRYRRLDPPARRAVRHHRPQAHLRPGVALRHDRVRLQPRPGRADGAVGRGLRAAAERDDRLRPQGLDQPRTRQGRLHARSGQALAGLRVGLPKEFFAEGLNNEVAAAVEAAVTELKKLGATTVEISLANSKLAIPVYYVLAPAEASSNLSRFDGVRYGYRAPEYGNLDDMYCKTRAQGFGAEVKRRILIGAYVLSHGYYDAYYLQAQKIRRLIAEDFSAAFKTCDVILGPTAPGTAFKLGEKSDDPVEMYLNDLYTIPANLAGLPGMSLPCGFDSKGLPIGLQLVGDYFSEAKMLNVAHQYQRVTDWHSRQPEDLL